ncbi:MAG: transcription termination factor Rho [Alphaproteobacteria bacterium]|nr:MAG: transcription termination factor Rho [Alphaproteobacteria bacterium]
MDLCSLRQKKNPELVKIAESLKIDLENIKHKELLLEIVRAYCVEGYTVKASGVLEVMNDGYGFIRFASEDYTISDDDIYVHQQFVSKLNLRPGDEIEVYVKTPEKNSKNYSVRQVVSVNGKEAKRVLGRQSFDSLTALYPNKKINLEMEQNDLSLRVLDCIVPIGFGQRALIVAPPRTGKTSLMQSIANAIHKNHPDVTLIVLLIGERPEEVTDMARSVHGEVISSTFDEPSARHVKVADMVIERAKRMVENGKDVVILMDSITRLARAYNTVIPSSGKVLTGGVDAHALQYPKKFFGSARNIEEGGSLTIIATALVETGSKMDEVIFEEFKGTGNAEIILDRKTADKRIFPALNILASGTRKEELLSTPDRLSKVWLLRKVISEMTTVEALEFLLDKLGSTKNNDHFFRMIGNS